MSYLSIRQAHKPPDRYHQFGHGKFESLGALSIAALLVVAAWEATITSLEALRVANTVPTLWGGIQGPGLGLGPGNGPRGVSFLQMSASNTPEVLFHKPGVWVPWNPHNPTASPAKRLGMVEARGLIGFRHRSQPFGPESCESGGGEVGPGMDWALTSS